MRVGVRARVGAGHRDLVHAYDIYIYAYDLVHSYDDIGGDGALQLLLVRPLLSHLLLNLLQRQWLLAL